MLNSGTVNLSRVDVNVASPGTITAGTLQLFPGSSLSGTGAIQANLITAAATNPGTNGAGILTIDGNFTQNGAGALNLQLDGITAGSQYGQLDVSGVVQLDGSLDIALVNGFTPQVGDPFSIINFGSKSGEFAAYQGFNYGTGQTFQTLYTANNLSLVSAVADIRVFPATGLLTSKAGDATSFTVVLATQPTANVTLALSSSNTSEGTVSPSSLTFTSSNWNEPQTVTVTGVNDGQPGSASYNILFAPAISSDPNYNGLTPSALRNLGTAGAAPGGVLGSPIYDPVSNENLYVVTQGTWTAAEAAAQALGGNLITIHSAAENTFIVNNVLQDFTSSGGPNLSDLPLWIGLFDPNVGDGSGAAHAADFQWVDGSNSTFRNWNTGEPDNSSPGEYDTAINWQYSEGGSLGTWNDTPAAGTSGYGGNTNGPYYGIVAVPASGFSITNLPDEVENIQVANLAVNPSTGLNEGSSFTINWNDTNTGNMPAIAAWDDQVVITNTTTGDTLTTALVHTDPDVEGVLAPGGSLAQEFTFTLPTTADGTGNIQITITANVDHSAFESATSLTNANLRTYSNGGDYPAAPTMLSVGGVDFALIPDGTVPSSLGILQTGTSGSSVDIPVNIAGGTVLNTLINSAYGIAGDTVGTVEVKGTNGADAIFNLVEGTNIRDHNNDGYENAVAAGTPSATFGNGQVRLDMQTFTLPAAFATATITDIILTSQGGTPQGNPFLAAATVATTSGPSQFVLLGSGVVPDVTNDATTTVVSGSAVPGQVSVVLDPASDSGVKGDDRTDITTPTFDVTVNEDGVIQVDFKGDGTATAMQTVAAAGQYQFTAPALPDGTFTTKVSFTPTTGTAAAASVTVTIDTNAPTLLVGSSIEQGPLYTRTLTFSKAIDAATIGTSSILVSGPGITGQVQPASVIGSGTTYVVTFSSPLAIGGTYTLQLAAGIADLAGNMLGSGVTDTFQLTPDTAPPYVAAVSPSGPTSANVSSLTVTFNKAINASTFTSGEVTITGPNGAIPTGSITVTEVDASDYTVTFPQQTQEATYNVSVGGPGVLDISGNAMTAAYLTSFTIDRTPPTVVSSTPTGTVNEVVDNVDVTFSKLLNASTLNSRNITLTGPGGAVTVGQGYLLSGTTYRIPIATQRANGSYQLTVGAGVQDQAGNPLGGSGYQTTFTVSLPDLVVNSVTPSASSADFGDTLGVSWNVTNNGTAGATGPWTDNVYLSTTPTRGAGAIFLELVHRGSSQGAGPGRVPTTARRPSSCRSTRPRSRAPITWSCSPMPAAW